MRRAKTFVLVALCFSIMNSSAQAESILDSLKNYAGFTVTGWSDLEAKRLALETEITEALKTGKLTVTQAADFRAQLKPIADAELEAKASGRRMSFRENVSFSRDIYTISAQIQQAINTHVTALPDVDTLQSQLEAKVASALSSGHLTAQDAATLRAELQRVAAMEAAYKTDTGGALTPRQIEILVGELNTAQSHIDQQIKLGESAIPQLNNRRTALLQRITDATAAGKLSAQDAAAIRTELDQIAAKQSAFAGTANMLTGSQVLTIASQLDGVEAHLDAKLGGAAATGAGSATAVSTAEVDVKQEHINSRLKDLLAEGKLSPALEADNRAELEQIAALEQAYKSSVGGITTAQVQQLVSALDRLSYRINRQVRSLTYGGGRGDAWRGGGRDDGLGRGDAGRGQFDGRGDQFGRRDDERRGGRRGDRIDGGKEQVSALPANVNVGAATTAKINLPIVSPKDFNDVRGYWAQPYVNELASRAVIGGFPDGSFKPNDEITRAQFASIVTNALKLPTSSAGSNFTDVPAKHWAANSIAAVANAGLVGGFPDGTFHPEDKLTRAQALVILAKALHSNTPPNVSALNPYTDKQAVPSWASDSVASAAQAHIIANFPDASQIRPNALATRGEVAALMYQTLNALGADLPKTKVGVL